MLPLYSFILLVHVSAGMFLIGNAVVGRRLRQGILAATSPGALRTLLSVFTRAAHAGPPLAVVVLATSVDLGSYGAWAQPWFYVAIGLWVLQAALAARAIRPTARALAGAVGAEDATIAPAVDVIRRLAAWAAAGAVMRGNDVSMLFLMLDKPPLVAAVTVVLCAATLSVLVEVARERRRPQRDYHFLADAGPRRG